MDVQGMSKRHEPIIRVTNDGDFSVHYELRYTINNFEQYIEIEAEIMNLLWYRFKRAGINIPMPIRDVRLTQVTPESALADKEGQADEILTLMEKVEVLTALSKLELKKLVRQVRTETYSVGEVPVRQGDQGDSFYIIKSGKVDVVVKKSGGGKAVVATLGAGNFFGEMSLLTGAVRTASIHVKEDAEFIIDKVVSGLLSFIILR